MTLGLGSGYMPAGQRACDVPGEEEFEESAEVDFERDTDRGPVVPEGVSRANPVGRGLEGSVNRADSDGDLLTSRLGPEALAYTREGAGSAATPVPPEEFDLEPAIPPAGSAAAEIHSRGRG